MFMLWMPALVELLAVGWVLWVKSSFSLFYSTCPSPSTTILGFAIIMKGRGMGWDGEDTRCFLVPHRYAVSFHAFCSTAVAKVV